MAWEVSQHENQAALVRSVANQWVVWIQRQASANPDQRSSVALGGGRVFRAFLESARRLLRANPAGLDRLEFFWGDERCVPPDDPESNFRMGQESFLGPLGVAPNRIHRLRGEVVPGDAARDAESVLRALIGGAPDGMPALDLVFLGMGEDGHIASLFPGAPIAVVGSSAVFLPVIGPKPPPQRLTLSYQMLAAAREVWVIASGAGKTNALRESLSQSGGTPLARVLRERKFTRILTDIECGACGSNS